MHTVPQWMTEDIAVTCRTGCADPYREVQIAGTFTHGDGTSLTLDAFWDGGDRFVVRFAPTQTGIWHYRIAHGDETLAEGELTCVPYTGENALYRHGFLHVTAGERFLRHADGTPFFWLGDTHWLGLGGRERLDSSNFPLFSSMFRGTADLRRLQGYTVYQMNFFLSAAGDCDGTGTSNEGGKLWLDRPFGQLNAAFFQNTDERLRYLAAKGITPCLGMDWGHAPLRENYDEFTRAVRYVAARYAALPVVWFVAGEFAGNAHWQLWDGVARELRAHDPYRHVMTIHGCGENFVADPNDPPHAMADVFRDADWCDMIMIQTGHLPRVPDRNVWRHYYDKTPVKPIFEAEEAYEGIWEVREPLTREQAYLSVMHGAFGVTYGAEGVWDATWDTNDVHQVVAPWWPIPWYDAVLLPAGRQMGYLRQIFESVDWWDLVPVDDLRLSHPLGTMRDIVAKADPARDQVLIYYPSSPEEYDTLVQLPGLRPGAVYAAAWANPMTGEQKPADDLTADGDGVLTAPPRTFKAFDRMLILRRLILRQKENA